VFEAQLAFRSNLVAKREAFRSVRRLLISSIYRMPRVQRIPMTA